LLKGGEKKKGREKHGLTSGSGKMNPRQKNCKITDSFKFQKGGFTWTQETIRGGKRKVGRKDSREKKK